MSENTPPLFDFQAEAARYEETIKSIRAFASHAAFRSAKVEELVLEEDSYRRPVRPQDLSFIDFRQPATPAKTTSLPFLAAQRLLLSINELKIARLPPNRTSLSSGEFFAFYGAQTQKLGAAVKPFLEAFSFAFLERDIVTAGTVAEMSAHIGDVVQTEAARWRRIVSSLAKADYLEDGLRFILIQHAGLAPSKRFALAGPGALGFFDILPQDAQPSLVHDWEQLAKACGITKRAHAYWQFYLSTRLACCNLLHSFASRPDRALQLCGAAFAAEAESLAFSDLVAQVGPRFTLTRDVESLDVAVADLTSRVGRALAAVSHRYGRAGLRQVAEGMSAMEALAKTARQDLDEQLRWLSSIERYKAIAKAIDARINTERPNIDRETFVEPQEMCSTTHVHDDHRLVVIESGDMVFWGNLGMTLRLKPGEMLLVPQGRLHGSSIESNECTYHQPIIPDAWVQPHINDGHHEFTAS